MGATATATLLAMLVLPRLSQPSLLVESTVVCMAPPTIPQLPTLTSTPLPSPTCTLRSQLSPTLTFKSLPSPTSMRRSQLSLTLMSRSPLSPTCMRRSQLSPTSMSRSPLSPTLMSRSLPSLTSTRSPLPWLLQSSPVTLLSQLQLTPTTTPLSQLLTPTTTLPTQLSTPTTPTMFLPPTSPTTAITLHRLWLSKLAD